jgi:hypothetical protein
MHGINKNVKFVIYRTFLSKHKGMSHLKTVFYMRCLLMPASCYTEKVCKTVFYPLHKITQLTGTVRVESLYTHWSPFVSCFVYNKPKVKFMHRSDHTEHCIVSHKKTRHFRGWIRAGTRDFCPLQRVHTGSGAHTAPCLMGTSPSFRE